MILVACSRRKRAPVDATLCAADLFAGSLDAVAAEWRARLTASTRKYLPSALYGGRSFAEALSTSKHLGIRLAVISAGLGVVEPEALAPSYSLTTAGATDENVLSRCPPGTKPADWWRATFQHGTISRLLHGSTGRIYLALPQTYLDMIADELTQLDVLTLDRLRIFTAGERTLNSSALRHYVMPYDGRLDGPDSLLPGTKSDFASRALKHFSGIVSTSEYQMVEDDRASVQQSLDGMRYPEIARRTKKSDAEVQSTLLNAWHALGGNKGRLLRHLRDDMQIACEQSRFSRLARELEEAGRV